MFNIIIEATFIVLQLNLFVYMCAHTHIWLRRFVSLDYNFVATSATQDMAVLKKKYEPNTNLLQ